MKKYFGIFLKGIGMGSANVIPGVSGGTIALITGVFERLIDAIKSFNIEAIKLLFSGKFRELAQHIDLYFLLAIFSGMAVSILSIARLFDYLFENYPVFIWSYFFGLILASIYFVGRTVERWHWGTLLAFFVGLVVAISISLMTPATENSSPLYLVLCGVIAACSMILPGLSGSFVLILLGNYKLVMIDAVNNLDFAILAPVVVGAVLGLLGFSYILSWVFKRYRDQTISLLTGFIAGSLGILWPWKSEVMKLQPSGELMLKSDGSPIISGYEWLVPNELTSEVLLATVFMVLGIVTIVLLERLAKAKN